MRNLEKIVLILTLLLFATACEQLASMGLPIGSDTLGGDDDSNLPNQTSQWAYRAEASSSFAGKYSQGIDDQSPFAATGEPDVEDCGNYAYERYAWSPAREDEGIEWLELYYDEPVYVKEIFIKEISPKGAITKIEVKNDTEYFVVWEGKDPVKYCPDFLKIELKNMTPFYSDTVKVTIDTDVDGWNLIDAVELIGYEDYWYILNGTVMYE